VPARFIAAGIVGLLDGTLACQAEGGSLHPTRLASARLRNRRWHPGLHRLPVVFTHRSAPTACLARQVLSWIPAPKRWSCR